MTGYRDDEWDYKDFTCSESYTDAGWHVAWWHGNGQQQYNGSITRQYLRTAKRDAKALIDFYMCELALKRAADRLAVLGVSDERVKGTA